jgi:hypothetical protein
MTTAFTPTLNIRRMHDHFNSPVTTVDCGKMCAPHNPNGKPFCCDICHAVPAAYRIEWHYLQSSTDLWHVWRGDECLQETSDPQVLLAETPAHMLLLACKGPAQCQRPYRAMSCRQFPFFPYITAGDRFIGLAYEWACEPTCWVISHLEKVTPVYRQEFIASYDHLLAVWPDEFEGYACKPELMREHFASQKRRIPLLHRNGSEYLLSPKSERIQPVSAESLKQFGYYRIE